MPVWFWVINPVLWAVSICLAGLSIRFILKGVHDLKRAKWADYAEKYEEFLDRYENHGERYGKMIEQQKKMISEIEELLKNSGNKVPRQLLLNLVKHLGKLQKNLGDDLEKYSETIEEQSDLHNKLLEFIGRGGIAGFSTLNQIEATKNIAIAAVLMALSGIGFSTSGIISGIAG